MVYKIVQTECSCPNGRVIGPQQASACCDFLPQQEQHLLFSELFLSVRQYHSRRVRSGLRFFRSRFPMQSTPSVLFRYSVFPPGVLFFASISRATRCVCFPFFYSFSRAREFSLSLRVSSTVPNYYRLRGPAPTRIQSEVPRLRVPSSDSASSE